MTMTNPNDVVYPQETKTETPVQEWLSSQDAPDGVAKMVTNIRTSTQQHHGLTKREYFAAMALQGIVSNTAMVDTESWEWLSKASVAAADALITALNGKK